PAGSAYFSVDAVGPRPDAVAAHAGLDLGGGCVVGRRQQLERPRRDIEDGELGAPAARLARRVDRARIDEIELVRIEPQPRPGKAQVAELRAVRLEHRRFVALAEQAE